MDWRTRQPGLVTHHFTLFAEIKGQASKHLRLAPAVHRDVVPTQMQPAGAERAVGLDPIFQNPRDHRFQRRSQLRKTVAQQQT